MKKMRNTKSILLLALMVIIALCSAGGTLAYLIDTDDPVQNVFTPSEVTCAVAEKFENNVKSDVTIQNTGNVSAYIRAAIVVTWQDAQGNVYGEAPVMGTDYSMNLNTDDWKVNDGFYYYVADDVEPSRYTPVLITECKPLQAAPAEGYTLHVEVIGGAIQSEGDAVEVGADGGWIIQ